ncbi:Gfo/Idh/MocA family protein [Halosimplex amylolyticum]|uniref:Gfo/Idh/MocA family protein n=1 Tax=Halosimplex amylolyticum TaxID=3396616 RepID=UPI003F578136
MTYRAGIIGTGGIAGMGILGMHDEEKIGQEKIEASHAGGYEATENLELVAAADVDSEKLNRFGDAWELPIDARYEDHTAMLKAEDLDVVSVCTPSYLHHDHVVDAARSSASPDVIWCEKPIASSVAEADAMCAACADTDTELVVNHSFRFTKKFQQLRQLIREENIIGQPQSITAQYRMELMRNSTHVLDTLLYLMNIEPAMVGGYINGTNEAVDALDADVQVTDAGGSGFVVTEGGAVASIDCTVPREESSMTFNIIGDKGKLYLNNDDGEWRYWRLENGEHVESDLQGINGTWTWEGDYKSAFLNAAQHIADLLTEDVENRSPGEVATKSLAIIVSIYLSHHIGGRVELPIDKSLRDVSITSW